MADNTNPSTPSSDYAAMLPYWMMVQTILAGAAAMRAAGQTYLPKFEAESPDDYELRRKHAKFTNIYRDIVENLAAKPFSKEVALVDGKASETVKSLLEDIDGAGNNLHVFASHLFFAGINDAVSWILVDKTPVPEGANRKTERDLGARPYWINVPAIRLLAAYSATINGKEEFVHVRIHEPETIRDGFGEKSINRVRVLDRAPLDGGGFAPATWELFEERKNTTTGKDEWISIGSGPIAIGVISIVPFITGRRQGGSWRFIPPMQDAAYLQVEHYQQESGLKYASENTAFPMLAGNGVTPPVDAAGNVTAAPVGPKRVLYAPPTISGDSAAHGEWKFIEPTAASLKFLADQIKATEQQLRELGRQPLTAQTGNLTVVTTAFAAQKGNTAIQAWALNLKDALEQALALTAMWLGETAEPEVTVHRDFAIDVETDKAADVLLKMREANDISREALIEEAKRRDWLSPEYDAEEDMALILAAVPGEDEEDDIKAAA